MIIRDIITPSLNKKNNQISFYLRRIKLKKLGVSPSDLLNLKIPKKMFKQTKRTKKTKKVTKKKKKISTW
jgi:hypothetical protein